MNGRLRARALAQRLAASLLGASAFGLAISLVDASFARAGSDAARQRAFALTLADAGLIAPVALAVGLGASAVGLMLSPSSPPSPQRLVSALRGAAAGRAAGIAAFVPLTILGALVWMTFSAHLARALLALDVGPGLAGAAIGAGALALGFLAGLAVLALTPSLRHALATASAMHPACVDPVVTGSAGLAVAALLVGFGVATGGVSGEGGLFGIYGIWKRPELDLRAPSLLLAIAVAALLAPAVVTRVRPLLALVLALAPLWLTARAASKLNGSPVVAQAVERGAPLGKPALKALRRLTDRDHDGVSGLFGGGDCDDRDPRVSPLAAEIPDNGVDEDCSGVDLRLASIEREARSAPPPHLVAPPADAPRVPADLNIILLTIDTLRADVGYAGNPRPVTPNLDKLAARGIVFERAYALASYTGKSVGPMMIGKYPSETHRNWGHSNAFGREDLLLAERLTRAGVHTMSVQAMRYFGRQSGLDRGFDVLDMSAAPAEGLIKDMENSVTGDRVSDAALKLLASPDHTGKRFFMWIHYLDPHADYLPHDELPSFGTSQRDLYDGEIAFTDKQAGRVLDAIARAPWGARTAVIVTSDHGEAFNEHKMVRHGFELWEELVRVPLLVYVPGFPKARIAARRSAVDLVPTILELMGVEAPTRRAPGNDFLSGVSLVPELTDPKGAGADRRDVLIDMPAGPFNDARRSLIHGDLKLTISNESSIELYDLAQDPEERQDLWDDPQQQKAIMPTYEMMKASLREVRVIGTRQ
jgi:choline-sulfatase